MNAPSISYSNIVIKQRIEAWAEGLEFDPEEQILMLLEDKYGAMNVAVVDAYPDHECLMLKLTTDLWKQPREFALLKSGSLVS